jgi:hypothetical protein
MSFASPKAILNALLPRAAPPAAEEGAVSREAAFRRFISDLERRGGGEQVPDFPAGLQWFNAPPLRLNRSCPAPPSPLPLPHLAPPSCCSFLALLLPPPSPPSLPLPPPVTVTVLLPLSLCSSLACLLLSRLWKLVIDRVYSVVVKTTQ